jgi:hypothetical protein
MTLLRPEPLKSTRWRPLIQRIEKNFFFGPISSKINYLLKVGNLNEFKLIDFIPISNLNNLHEKRSQCSSFLGIETCYYPQSLLLCEHTFLQNYLMMIHTIQIKFIAVQDPPPSYEQATYNTQYGVHLSQQIVANRQSLIGLPRHGVSYPQGRLQPQGERRTRRV